MTLKDTKIAVLGDGGWGTTLSLLLSGNGYPVTLWGFSAKYLEEMRQKRENVKFLPGFKIPENIALSSDLKSSCENADLLVLAVPSQHMRSVVQKIDPKVARKKDIVTVAKGIETSSLKVMSQVIREELGRVKLCSLSGPNIAREIALKTPSAASVASDDKELAARVRKIFMADHFNLFISDDVLGVELGGALKNVIAISAGIVEGLGFGSNTRAALFARGLAEMARLGHKMGAKRETFMGLSGLGDLATTCISPLSRNRSFGERIGRGESCKKILAKTEMVVEGVETSKAAFELAKKHRVEMPITESVYRILFHGHNPREAVTALMKSGPFRELD